MPNIAVEGRIFGFHLEPYYLPLVLPGAVRTPGSDATTVENAQDGTTVFTVTLDKVQRGEQFEGLDGLQAQLLPEDQLKQALVDAEQSKGFFEPASQAGEDAEAKSLLQQALRSQGLVTVADNDGEAALDDEMISTQQATVKDTANAPGFGIGLGGKARGALIPAGCADTRNVLEVADPGSTEPAARYAAAVAYEEERWDEGIYMDNYLDIDGELDHVLRFTPTIPASDTAEVGGEAQTVEALAVVVELLFALSYDERTNEGEATVESGWTIAKLSRSLSASSPPRSAETLDAVVAATLVGCVRRALTVPLYRHWRLAQACIDDTLLRLRAGRAHVISCLHQIASRLDAGDDAVLQRLQQIWIAPLLAQPPSAEQLQQLSQSIEAVRSGLAKDTVGGEWDLEVVEQAAQQAYNDGEGGFV
ncbi:uncharacterized protein PAN0_070d6581 [Moesziomyces antarcticus]|uniref:Uncharacterized protein n=2 Tax=Pseudozyma antarctica TaxID=84753 RepID=A0A081CNU0_PSEA2|nr:uncharacterized protein PAN0_070d6581 [Moesziomyces antarcticus]GAK68336.1 conserved hypothetical protein [Moesziomyces antarcticus]SPO47220.1 uncharacterized protein PSANT_04908 [Moesziomyces antarcticus]